MRESSQWDADETWKSREYFKKRLQTSLSMAKRLPHRLPFTSFLLVSEARGGLGKGTRPKKTYVLLASRLFFFSVWFLLAPYRPLSLSLTQFTHLLSAHRGLVSGLDHTGEGKTAEEMTLETRSSGRRQMVMMGDARARKMVEGAASRLQAPQRIQHQNAAGARARARARAVEQ